ncbi:MAG TPA: HEAT repeat domain-containing protein [Candidatus Bathyarchaeia archaeon]|nr:HEAT repeat domain-containing protein [Candidatus Bathyarchaeia archaeon]
MAKIIKIAVIVIVVVLALPLVAILFQGGKESLTGEEQQVWDRFLAKHLSSGTETPSEADADAVAAIGDRMVPYIEEQFGAAAQVPRTYGKSEYWLVIILARIGTPRAIDAIVKVLEHDWRGAVGTNRETAAKALVWLGAGDRISALEAAIADHERLVADSKDPQRYGAEVADLKKYLELLKKGEGKRDKSKFPFGPALIMHEIGLPTVMGGDV